MADLFTYASLGTLTGATMATVLVVEILKNLGPVKRLPTRLVVLAVAAGIVVLTNIATGNFALRDVPLYLLNALLVTASAIGSWQVLRDKLFDGSGKEREAEAIDKQAKAPGANH